MKKLMIFLLLALFLTGCGGEAVTGQVLEVWEDQVLLAPDAGGRITLTLPENLEDPPVGERITFTCRDSRILRFQAALSPAPEPTGSLPEIPQLTP